MREYALRISVLCVFTAGVLIYGGAAGIDGHMMTEKELVNRMEIGTVQNQITENFNGTKKTNVRIQNTGNLNSYVRVAVIPVWKNPDGSFTPLDSSGTYHILLNTDDWAEGSDGFYYYRYSLQPNELTSELIKSCTIKENLPGAYQGKIFDLQIISQSQTQQWDIAKESA